MQPNTQKYARIAISRTDNIGDVVLALPVAGIIRKYYPESERGHWGCMPQ